MRDAPPEALFGLVLTVGGAAGAAVRVAVGPGPEAVAVGGTCGALTAAGVLAARRGR